MSKLLYFKASLYNGAALSNTLLLHESLLIRLLMEVGNCRRMEGAWFDERLI